MAGGAARVLGGVAFAGCAASAVPGGGGMNPWELSATELLVWGLLAHLVADWLLQSDWMAANKAERAGDGSGGWWDRHPAAYAHAGVHALAFAPLLGWVSLPLAVVHLVIDTRTPVAWWARLIRQTPPNPEPISVLARIDLQRPIEAENVARYMPSDIDLLVRMAVDQAWHVVTIAVAALLVTL